MLKNIKIHPAVTHSFDRLHHLAAHVGVDLTVAGKRIAPGC